MRKSFTLYRIVPILSRYGYNLVLGLEGPWVNDRDEGVARNGAGEWVCGFSTNLLVGDALLAKLIAIQMGLEML
ncbi:hypothetical protein RJT34_25030 [Clitoria ternatea]|uniref:Uncharacterized protein n=1 Tax=Clitoria ternatea TaxID=43366 RepID=A0AAN9IGH6_CLITE